MDIFYVMLDIIAHKEVINKQLVQLEHIILILVKYLRIIVYRVQQEPLIFLQDKQVLLIVYNVLKEQFVMKNQQYLLIVLRTIIVPIQHNKFLVQLEHFLMVNQQQIFPLALLVKKVHSAQEMD